MKAYQIGTSLLAALALVVTFQNCGGASGLKSASSQSDSDGKTSADEISSRYSLIEQIAARDLSCNTDTDCATVALGNRACGGPKDYVVVSQNNADIEQIDALAIELEQKEREFNAESGQVGMCDYRMPPTVACVSNICQ